MIYIEYGIGWLALFWSCIFFYMSFKFAMSEDLDGVKILCLLVLDI